MKEIAHEILKCTTEHFRSALLASMETDEAKKNAAINNMKLAEENLSQALENFKQSILNENKNF